MTWDYYDIKKKLPDNITGVEMRRMSDAKSYKKLVAWLQKNYNDIFKEYMNEQLENKR
tara:strand:+ start:108 stop:281 length:174 start_codon:yes stop_codon:yes gene_type:complete